MIRIMNTNNFSSWEKQYESPDILKNHFEQEHKEHLINQTKKWELFQETFPTENYKNLEPDHCRRKKANGWDDYFDKITSKTYS